MKEISSSPAQSKAVGTMAAAPLATAASLGATQPVHTPSWPHRPQCVAEKHLNDDEDTHCRQEDDAQDFFNVFIKKTQYLHVEFNLLLEKSYLFSLSYKKLWNGAAANAAAPFF